MISWCMLVDVLKSDFSVSAYIPFGPDDFPFFNVLIALLTSFYFFGGGLVLFICSISSAD